MTDLKTLVDTLIRGTPWAMLIAATGAILQIVYAYTRDKLNDREAALRRDLEREKFEQQKAIEVAKFEHQREIDRLRFEYEKIKWREQLALQLAQKHVEARLVEYPQLWLEVRAVAWHNSPERAQDNGSLTKEKAKEIADFVESWRYSKGGLLAEETTRDAAMAIQAALWNYDGSNDSFRTIRRARKLLRSSLRADIGLGTDSSGNSIFDATAARHKISEELAELNESISKMR